MKRRIRADESRFVPRCANWALRLCLAFFAAGCLNPLPDDLPAEKDTPARPVAAGSGAPQGPSTGGSTATAAPPPTTSAPDGNPMTDGAAGSSPGSASEAPDAGAPPADAGPDAAPEPTP